MTFFSLITTAFSSIFYGLLATAAVMAVLYLLLTAISNSIKEQPSFYFVGGGLALLLFVQLTLMIGAMQARDLVDDAALMVKQAVNGVYGHMDMSSSQQVMDVITEHYPVIGSYFDIADFSGASVDELPECVEATLGEAFSAYIWRRVWWALGITVAAVAIVIFMDKPARSSRGRRSEFASRHDGRRGRTGSHQRVSRSRRH